jgi:hypothetical protein
LDGAACLQHPALNGTCLAAGFGGLGLVASAPQLAVGYGLAESPFETALALNIGGFYLGGAAVLGDVGQALYDELTGGTTQCTAASR